jgi:hypothetical protein
MEEKLIYDLAVGDRFAFKNKAGAYKKFKVLNFEQPSQDGATVVIYQDLDDGSISKLKYYRNKPGNEPIRVVKI